MNIEVPVLRCLKHTQMPVIVPKHRLALLLWYQEISSLRDSLKIPRCKYTRKKKVLIDLCMTVLKVYHSKLYFRHNSTSVAGNFKEVLDIDSKYTDLQK